MRDVESDAVYTCLQHVRRLDPCGAPERSHKRNPAVMLDQAALPWFAELNKSLHDAQDDDVAFQRRICNSVAQLNTLAREILGRACVEHPELDASALLLLLSTWGEASPTPDLPMLLAAA